MRIKHSVRLIAVVAMLVGAALLISQSTTGFTPRDKAFYAEANQINFVRPGLVIQIQGVDIAANGTVRARFKLTDPKGAPLDRDGITTPGNVSVSFVLAYIPKGQTQYVAYTTRTQKSPITNVSSDQASADSGGTFAAGNPGEYTYTFKTLLPKDYDPTVTHTVGAYGSRNLSEFDMGTNYFDTTFNFVPDGSKVTVIRDVIKTATCNKCHDQMAFHGGSRRSMEVCILCHQPQSIDPDTGNSVDMAVFVHKLHAGATLPSVKAGKKYQIIGHSQTVADYSDITFPADVRSCATCHEAGATQAQNVNKANRAACGSCHDDVNFATGLNHVTLPQVSDTGCTNCHVPKGESDFDASIQGAHLIPRFSTNLPGVVLSLSKVDVAKPAGTVTVTFSIKNKKGDIIRPADMSRLNLLLTGPNADYAMSGVAAGYITEDARKATCDNGGICTWTFAKPLPTGAKGSYTVAMEGRLEVKLMPNTVKEITVRDTGFNKQIAFSVDGSPVQPRRQIVSTAKCNACHGALALHGDNRNDVNQCAVCHNPVMTGDGEAIDFRTMVHRIHRGNALTKTYKLGNTTFNEVGYPGDLRNCAGCHINNSQQLPVKATLPVTDPAGYITSVPPTTAACTSCHDTKSAMAHAVINTDPKQGESCDVCHGPSAQNSVDRSHAR